MRGRPIDDARFVPPPPREAEAAIAELEKFIHSDDFAGYPPLVRAALIHYQFETIHPFPDGNGKIGRLLIPLVLLEKKALRQPFLYLSPALETRKDEYMDRMPAVSRDGAWTQWLRFFLNAAQRSATQTISTIRALGGLREQFHRRAGRGRSSANLLRLIDFIFERPAVSIPMVQQRLKITYPPAKRHVDRLVRAQILRPMPLRTHPSYFIAQEIISVLERDPNAPPEPEQ
ncbi:MAG: Fic family protein [Alphaproteobacteria bacterium]|nr:Fic family protein [Alphaproteobacteria bacterium]